MMETKERPERNEYHVRQIKSRAEWVFEIILGALVAGTLAATAFAAYWTSRQWATADDAEYRSLRASVILNDLQIVPTQLNGVLIGYIVLPKWQNVGETSATSMTFRINYQFSRDDLPLGFTNIDGIPMTEGPADIAPKETLNVGGIRDATGNPLYYPQPCLLDMQQDKFRYSYIWGWAKYHDVFKPNILRVTRFCRRLYGIYTIRNELAFNQYLCEEGNCQDGACEKYNTMTAPRMPAPELCQFLKIPAGAQGLPPTQPAQPQPNPPAAAAPSQPQPPK
jgi:hypothetical protein